MASSDVNHAGIADATVFRYARTYQIIFLGGLAFFLGSTVLALRASPDHGGGLAWPAVLLFCFGLLNAALLWAMLPTFSADSLGITQERLGIRHRLSWRDIQRVEHRPTSASLVLCSGVAKIRIHRQIRGFLDLFAIIKRSVPPGAVDPPFALPFTVPASWNVRLVFGAMSGFFLILGSYTLFAKNEWKSTVLLLGLGAANLALLGWQAFLRFEFDSTGLRIVYPLRTVNYSGTDLDGAALVQRDLDIVVALQFRGKLVELSDNQIVIAPERVYDSLVQAYRLQEDTEDQTE